MIARGAVSGWVEDAATHDAIADAFVTAEHPRSGERFSVSSDGAGHFLIEKVPVGSVNLEALTEGGRHGFKNVYVSGAGETVGALIEVTTQGTTGTLRGKLYGSDASTPVDGAYVLLYLGGTLFNYALTADGGLFDFGTLPTGTYRLDAQDPVTRRIRGTVTVTLEDDHQEFVNIIFGGLSGRVTGYVKDHDGDPLSEIFVYAENTVISVTTGSNGGYELAGVPIGGNTITAVETASGRQQSISVQINRQDETINRDIVLPYWGQISGKVRGTDNSPLPSAIVFTTKPPRMTRSDGEGDWSFSNLPPGEYEVHALNPARDDGGSCRAQVTPSLSFGCDVTMRGRQDLEGHVYEAGQTAPAVGALVTLHASEIQQDGTIDIQGIGVAYTDSDGHFLFEDVMCGHGQVTVESLMSGRVSVSRNHCVDTEALEIELARISSLSGVVYAPGSDPQPVPVESAVVTLTSASLGDDPLETETDAEGAFVFDQLPTGRFNIAVHDDDGNQACSTVDVWNPGDEPSVAITLRGLGSLDVTVVEADTDPVYDATVQVRGTNCPYDAPSNLSTTSSNNVVTFTGRHEGEYVIYAWNATQGGRTSASVTLDENNSVTVTFEPYTRVQGTVFDSSGISVLDGVQVVLGASGGNSGFALTEEDGRFGFDYVPIGSYAISAFDPMTGRRGHAVGYLSQGKTEEVSV